MSGRPLSHEELLFELEKPCRTLILFHRNPDADALGSALALCEILSTLGSRVHAACETPLPSRLRFLSTDDASFGAGADKGFTPERIISVDTASPAQLGAFREAYENRVDIMIDHHASGTPFGNATYIDPKAAATGEILFSLVEELEKQGKMTFTPSLCKNLYAAISSDTGCFRFSNVTPKTHRIAARLLESGIDASEINHFLFESKSREQILAEGAAAEHLETYFGGALAVIPFPYSLKAELGISDEHMETLVDVARSLIGVKVALVIRQPEEKGVFRISARSSCSFDVAALCAKFGGGGHIRAAGCTVEAPDLSTVRSLILSEIKQEDLI